MGAAGVLGADGARALGARAASALVAAFVLALATTGEQRAAGQQDTMTPLALSTVTLGTVDTDAADDTSASTTITPADPRSNTIVEVPATVSVPGGVASDLVEVTLCLYLDAEGASGCAPAGGQTAEWASEDPDPTQRVVMTWRPDRVTTDGASVTDHGFAVVGSNLHLDASSTSDYSDLASDATDVTVTFRFNTSVALRAAAAGYKVRVVALDTNGNHSADAGTIAAWEQSGLTVSAYRAASTSRSPMAFGVLLPGGTTDVEGVSSGEFVANAPSALTIEATDFVHDAGGADESTIALRTTTGAPTSDPSQLAIDCNAGATFDAVTALRLGTSPGAGEYLEEGLYATGTGETGDARTHSCRMTYGGGASGVGREHGGTISISIVPDPS